MARNILILGASYGSLLATKLLMAGHNVTLVCRKKTAELINRDGTEGRIKLRDEPMHRAIFSALLTGNYRCITLQEPKSIRDAVHDDLKLSHSIYDHVDAIARRLGADATDQVPFEKYAKAAESLLKPSSAARAVSNGAPFIERVDLL